MPPFTVTPVTKALRLTACGLCVAVLGACGTPRPPAPPAVDESARRPVNDPAAVERERQRVQIHNLQLQVEALGSRRHADEALAAARAAMLKTAAVETSPTAPGAATGPANEVYVIPFGIGQTDVRATGAELAALLNAARAAAYVVVRGRTDGNATTPGEAAVAKGRALSTRAFLVGAGVDPSRIRVTHQAAGDHLADNTSPAGRQMNRRVEVELYATRPHVTVLGTQQIAQAGQ